MSWLIGFLNECNGITFRKRLCSWSMKTSGDRRIIRKRDERVSVLFRCRASYGWFGVEAVFLVTQHNKQQGGAVNTGGGERQEGKAKGVCYKHGQERATFDCSPDPIKEATASPSTENQEDSRPALSTLMMWWTSTGFKSWLILQMERFKETN